MNTGDRATAPGAGRVLPVIDGLNISQFAFVMATGIISSALLLDRVRLLSIVMLVLALIGYVLLGLLHGIRLFRLRSRVIAELSDARGFAFLAFVAASNVLATRLAIGKHAGVALAFLAIGCAGWLLLGYGIPLAMLTRARGTGGLLERANGTWFMWVVGTQSVAVACLACVSDVPQTTGVDSALVVFGGVCWAIGLLQYLLISPIVLARLLLRGVDTDRPVAPYWIFMGSAAITILAGALLLDHSSRTHLLAPQGVAILSMILWSFASWLVPFLTALVLWRALRCHGPLRYRTEWWAAVFPIGMYGVASHELGSVEQASWLAEVGMIGAWVALPVWLFVVVMAIRSVVRESVRGHPARTA